MKSPTDTASNSAAASDFLGHAVEVMMIALVACIPFGLQGHAPWVEPAIILLAGGMAFCVAARAALRGRTPFRWTWAYVPLVLLVLLGVLQLVPLGPDVAQEISPDTVATQQMLLGDSQVASTVQLTLYPLATRASLRMLLAIAMVFIVAVTSYRRPEQVKRLLGAVAAVGAGFVLLALVQRGVGGKTPWAKGVSWQIPYCQYLSLAFGSALGLLLVKLRERSRGDRDWPDYFSRPMRPDRGFGQLTICALALAGCICAGGIFLARTRVAVLAASLAGAVTVGALALQYVCRKRSWLLAPAALIIIGFGAWAVGQVSGHLGSADQWVDKASTIRFLNTGTGLGTYDVAKPLLEDSGAQANGYVRLMSETGPAGGILLLGFLAVVWFCYVRLVGPSRMPIHSAALGLGFGLLVVMLCGLSGTVRPAVFPVLCLAALFAGLLTGLRRVGGLPAARRGRVGRGFSTLAAVAAMFGVVAVSAWAATSSIRAHLAEAYWQRAVHTARRLQKENSGPDGYRRLLPIASRAANMQADNVTYRVWLNVWRWRAAAPAIETWQTARDGEVALQATARTLAANILSARRLCPTYGPAYYKAGELETFVLNRPEGAAHIRRGLTYAPNDAEARLVAGWLALHHRRAAAARKMFRRAVAMDKSIIRRVTDVCIHREDRPEMALSVARGNINALLHVAAAFDRGEHPCMAAEAREEALTLLEEKCREPDAPAWAFACAARLHARNEDHQAAVGYYRRALTLKYAQVHWRGAMAQALAKIGQDDKAIHQARICLRFQPTMKSMKSLIAKLTVRSSALADRH